MSFSSCLIIIIPFSCHFMQASTISKMLKISGDNGHLCFVPIKRMCLSFHHYIQFFW